MTRFGARTSKTMPRMDIHKEVLRYVQLSNELKGDDMDSWVRKLRSETVTELEAEALVAFVPMGFAHVALSAVGVTLPAAFVIRDFDTQASARGMLKDEPIFEAAKALAREMLEDPARKASAMNVAQQSAEWTVVRQLCPDRKDLDGCELTEPVLARLPVQYLNKPEGRWNGRLWLRGRWLFIAEAAVIVLPLTALLVLALPLISIPGRDPLWPFGAMDLIIVLATVATASGWRLLIAGIQGRAEALRNTHRGWWFAASLGCVLVLAGTASSALPPSPEYSPAAIFREHLDSCILGWPLVLVLIHLWAEARFRKSNVS